MFVKVALLFCCYIFPTKTLARGVTGDVPVNNITEQQYNELKGPDFCGKSANDVDTLKNACTKVAIREELIKCGESVPFTKDHPKCAPAQIQFYDCQGNKAKTKETKLVDCANTLQGFAIGKGQASNDVMMYDCPNGVCEAYYNMPGVL